MIKKIICIFIIGCSLLILLIAHGEATEEDYSAYDIPSLQGMPIDELLALRGAIDDQLMMRGYVQIYDIAKGDKGEAVANLQRRLTELGYYIGNITGKYDTETQKAMKMFKKANGLDVTSTVATAEDQTVLFSDQAVAKTADISSSGNTADEASPKPTLSPQYADYDQLDYEDCINHPERYQNVHACFTGTVIQVVGSRFRGYSIRLATSGDFDNTIYLTVKENLGLTISEGDRLTVYATMTGTKTYSSAWNQEITIPSAIAEEIIVR